MQFPHEIQLRILSFIERPSYILPTRNSTENHPHAHTLNKLCRIKSWNKTATEELYKYVFLDNRNIINFIYGILLSCGSLQLDDFLLEVGPQLPIEQPEILEEDPIHFDDMRIGTKEFERRLNLAVSEAEQRIMNPITTKIIKGNGYFVKQLILPSWDQHMLLIRYLLPWIPNCINIKLNHPSHGPDFLPTVSPRMVTQLTPYFPQLQSFSVNDIDKKSWPFLLHALKTAGYNLKVLSLEACSELDTFTSQTGLSTIFPSLRNLECLRLDGLPVNSFDFTWGGDFDILILATLCPNLTAVALDYCDLTMESFFTLWNTCTNLEFLGLVGLTDESDSIPPLKVKERLTTLRFVDCQINDSMLEAAFSSCPNLNLLRIVFEFPTQFNHNQTWDVNSAFSDRSLWSLSKYCKNLKTLAISRTSKMSSAGFKSVLESCPVETLDFHCNSQRDNGTIGVLDEEFLTQLIPVLKTVKVLNLYEQTQIPENLFIRLISSNPQLTALCLSGCVLTTNFLSQFIEVSTSIKLLSIATDGFTKEDYGWFVGELRARGKNLDKIYTNLPGVEGILVYPDTWFNDQRLDIFSLWHIATSKH